MTTEWIPASAGMTILKDSSHSTLRLCSERALFAESRLLLSGRLENDSRGKKAFVLILLFAIIALSCYVVYRIAYVVYRIADNG